MESANDPKNKVDETKKDWREISKTTGMLITLVIVLFYAFAHWEFIQNGYFWRISLTIAFAIGISFGFLENIKPGTTDTLIFFHKKLNKEWGDGLCFVPSIFPFMHRVGIRPLWSLLNAHHNGKLEEEYSPRINHDVRINSADITQTKTEVDFWTLKKWEILRMFVKWFFSIHKNPMFILQDFGLKIILVVFIFDCLSLSTAGVVNLFSSKKDTVATQSIETVTQKETSKLEVSKAQDRNDQKSENNQPIILLPNFGWHNNSNQREKCRWTETNWNLDLVNENYLDMSKLGGCIDFHPPRGKQVGLLFNDRPIKTDGDFTVSSRYDEKICYFSSKDNCLDFIGSHLNQTLIFEGNFYVDTGK